MLDPYPMQSIPYPFPAASTHLPIQHSTTLHGRLDAAEIHTFLGLYGCAACTSREACVVHHKGVAAVSRGGRIADNLYSVDRAAIPVRRTPGPQNLLAEEAIGTAGSGLFPAINRGLQIKL